MSTHQVEKQINEVDTTFNDDEIQQRDLESEKRKAMEYMENYRQKKALEMKEKSSEDNVAKVGGANSRTSPYWQKV